MTAPILRYFTFDHLPEGPLRNASCEFRRLAVWLDAELPDGSEKSTAFRKLLEAKDAAVRAALDVRKGECTRPEMTIIGPFTYCDDPACPVHGAN